MHAKFILFFCRALTVVISISLTACAGGTRGTGIRTITNRNKITNDDSDSMQRRKSDYCDTQLGKSIFVSTQDGVSLKDSTDDVPCIFRIRDGQKQIIVEMSGLASDESMLTEVKSSDRKILLKKTSSKNAQIVLSGSTIPKDGVIEISITGPYNVSRLLARISKK